ATIVSGHWDEVEHSVAPDQTRINNIPSLQQGRDIQPLLVSDIASCLPKPDPALLNTSDASKLPPRSQRKIVRIDKLSMDYRDDVSSFTKMSDPEFNAVQIVGGSAPTPGSRAAPMQGRGGAAMPD